MNRLRRYKIFLSCGLVVLLTSAFCIKGLHHLEEHHHAPVCEEKNQKHFHSDHHKPHCLLCDFIFSPLTPDALLAGQSSPFYFSITVSSNYTFRFLPAPEACITLRGPPAFNLS